MNYGELIHLQAEQVFCRQRESGGLTEQTTNCFRWDDAIRGFKY